MSASKTKTFRLSHSLSNAIELRAKELGYKSATALVEALVRYDCLCQSSHGVTIQWSKLPLVDQDLLDAKILDRAVAKKGMPASAAAKVNWKDL